MPVVFSSTHLSFPAGGSYASDGQGSRLQVCYRLRNRTTPPSVAGLLPPWHSYRICRPRYAVLVVTAQDPSHPG